MVGFSSLSYSETPPPLRLFGEDNLKFTPLAICKKNFKNEKCNRAIARYVAMRFIDKNNDYYFEITVKRYQSLLREAGKVDKDFALFTKAKESVINNVADYWVENGALPLI